jgi:hypothetical protein
MASLGRAALLLLIAVTLAAAGIPAAFDEDRSVPGFCSPDCPLQQVAHSVAVAPAPVRPDGSVELAGEQPTAEPAGTHLAPVALPDAPRAPPLA